MADWDTITHLRITRLGGRSALGPPFQDLGLTWGPNGGSRWGGWLGWGPADRERRGLRSQGQTRGTRRGTAVKWVQRLGWSLSRLVWRSTTTYAGPLPSIYLRVLRWETINENACLSYFTYVGSLIIYFDDIVTQRIIYLYYSSSSLIIKRFLIQIIWWWWIGHK